MTPSSCSYPGSSTRQCHPHFRLLMTLIPYVTVRPRHLGHALHACLTPPTTTITCRHARLITLRARWESLNQIWLMQLFSSDRQNFPGGHPSRDYSMVSTLNYGVPIHMSSLKSWPTVERSWDLVFIY